MRKLLLMMTFVASLISCHDADDGLAIFKFMLINTRASEQVWVSVLDGQTGEILDTKQASLGAQVTFRTDKAPSGNTLAITVAHIYPTPPDINGVSDHISNCAITVYNDVAVGSEWTMSHQNLIGDLWITDEYYLNITEVPSVYAFKVSGMVSGLPIWSESNYFDGTISGTFDLTGQALKPKQLVILDPGTGTSRYRWVEKIEERGHVKFSFNDMKEFDKYFNFKFPLTSDVDVNVIGYADSPFKSGSFILYENNPWHADTKVSEINVGILDFPNYQFKVDIDAFHFASMGPLPKSIDFVDNIAFNVHKPTSISGYSVSTTRDYLYSYSYYNYRGTHTRYSLKYYSLPGRAKQFAPLNDDVLRQIGVTMEKFVYNSSSFIVKGRSYTEMINRELNVKYGGVEPIEEAWVTVVP
jgi:hypothetical protein